MNGKNHNPKSQQDQIQWLLILLAVAGVIILAALYIWFSISSESMTVQQALMKLFSDTIAGIVGALVSYLFIYFVFIKRGITIDINPQQIENIKQNIKQDITANSGEMIQGLINNMQRVGDSDLKLYTFYGLQNEVSQNNIFQDFNIAGENKNAIYFFWADLSTTLPSKIDGKIDKPGKFLHVSFENYVLGQVETAAKNVLTLMSYFKKHRFRFEGIIDNRVDPAIAMERPHIRFNGQALAEVNENWEHAQNDALGYFLWFYCKLASEGRISLQQNDVEMLGLFPLYFQSVQYWKDEDSGHWEEGRKIEASSIGTVVAGLKALRQLFVDSSSVSHSCQYKDKVVTPHLLDQLIRNGEFALSEILPAECIQPKPKERRYDGALLFLIYPLNVINEEISEKILQDVQINLQGEYGILRYLGDSFWCRNFFSDLPKNIQTSISTEREAWLETHNRTVKHGEEAQWCIFDPIISIIYGMKFQKYRQDADLEKQINYLNRALGQITDEKCQVGKYHIEQFKCPELYYIQDDKYIPNVSTPLLWTQANLMMALKSIEQSLRLIYSSL